MRMVELIEKKRDGGVLTGEEIRWMIEEYTKGEVPDYQMAAFLMAVYFRGMNTDETKELTFAIRDSGATLDFASIRGLRADKHSTGGVGDKTSLVVGPVVAACGLKVAKLSGRGLGFTGGTIDKLESIEGFRTNIPVDEFESIVNEVGIAIAGQSKDIAPADKLLYALRDVTGTVASLPLIVSSIMGKKLAANDDVIVLDVKCGSGAFMKTPEDAEKLAETMVAIGKEAGKKTRALITDMDQPLGSAVGNTLEVIEAIDTLKGKGPKEFRAFCIEVAAHMLELAGQGDFGACEKAAKEAIDSGKAFETFRAMVKAQGGNVRWIDKPELFPTADSELDVIAGESGWIAKFNTEQIGLASMTIGAGRSKKTDPIDITAGIRFWKKRGDRIEKGEKLATLYSCGKQKDLVKAMFMVLDATELSAKKPPETPLILSVVR
jgi:pyrimidine-nucleoside phosphorylase